jgi:hypothetical protein
MRHLFRSVLLLVVGATLGSGGAGMEKLSGETASAEAVTPGSPQPAHDPNEVACPACGERQLPGENCVKCGGSLEDALATGKAFAQVVEVEELIEKARREGHDTVYFEIVPFVARLGLETRWDLPEQGRRRAGYVSWALAETTTTKQQLHQVLAGKRKALTVPPVPDYADLEIRDGYLRQNGKPLLLFGVNLKGPVELRGRFFAAENMGTIVSGVGGTRFDYTEQPIWQAYTADPDTHRVWAGGEWCGHIICDEYSIHGGAGGPCIICLESPHTRQAVVEYFQKVVPALRDSGRQKFYPLDWEFAYICFCDRSLAMWRGWLARQYPSVDALNEVWGTDFADFDSVTFPALKCTEEPNRAKWYDFARFNCWRFTDYMTWARSEVRRLAPGALTSTGAPFYMLAGQMGWAGIDAEALDRSVNDVILNEAQPSTLTTDLLRSIAVEKKLIQDSEYHGDIAHIMAHFLHGDGYVSMWFWPEKLTPDPPSFYASDIGRSPRVPLEDVALCMRSALDVRRLTPYILPFHDQLAEVALLYSHDSMLQLPPELRQGRDTPHLFAIRTIYEGTVYLDAPTRFLTERQVDEGRWGQVKLLILPAVEYQNPTTQTALLDWVRKGGTLVSTPNSWLADQYARPADYLAHLGIRVAGMALPEVRMSAPRPDIEKGTGFIMGAISERELRRVPRSELEETADWPFAKRGLKLEGWGVQQTLEITDPHAKVIARLKDGRPAIVTLPVGEGTVYYFATPLEERSFHRFFDCLYDAAGVRRPVRAVDENGEHPFLVDSRTVATDDGYLCYVSNLQRGNTEVRLRLPDGVAAVTNLSTEEPVAYKPGEELTLSLGRYETVMLQLTAASGGRAAGAGAGAATP